MIPRQASTDGAISGRPTKRRIRPKRRTRVVLASWLAGLTALLALLVPSGPVANGVMFVKGSSMLPLLRPGQLLVLNRRAYRASDQTVPQRGDVIIFRRGAAGEEEYLVKRVIGLPGDIVLIDAGHVFVNGTRLDEPYVMATDDYTFPLQGGPARVPDGAYFVLGDNRPVSVDSHLGWFVPAGDVVGQVWPLPVAFPSLPALASA
jgi:signal peptidase I